MSLSKKIISLFILGLLFVGFGCQNNGASKVEVPRGWTTFESADYDFALSYPDNYEFRSRPIDQQDSSYVGLSGNFFASLRDIKREKDPVTLAAFYSFKGINVDDFSAALQVSDPDNITIKETSDLSQGGLAMKKIVNTTAMGVDKTHYLFLRDKNLIVVSVFLSEEENFAPVFATMRELSK